jgi:hypothetical protein
MFLSTSLNKEGISSHPPPWLSISLSSWHPTSILLLWLQNSEILQKTFIQEL